MKIGYTIILIILINHALCELLDIVNATIIVPTDYPTIQEALDMAASGETVLVQPGTYNEHLLMDDGKDYELTGADRDTTIINGTVSGTPLKITIENKFHQISNLTIQNSDSNGIESDCWYSSGVNIINCIIQNNAASGINLAPTVSDISYSVIRNNGEYGVFFDGYGSTEITGCEISYNKKSSIYCEGAVTACLITVDSSTIAYNDKGVESVCGGCWDDMVIRDSVLEHNTNTVIGFTAELIHLTLDRNMFRYNDLPAGIIGLGYDGAEIIMTNNVFHHNTFNESLMEFNAPYPWTGYQATIANNTFSDNTNVATTTGAVLALHSCEEYVVNNIFCRNNVYGISNGEVTWVDGQKFYNNNFFSNTPAEVIFFRKEYHDISLFNSLESCAANNISCDPEFIAPDDYHLNPTSCCIDQGTDEYAPSTDFEGDPRPLGAKFDIGADEYNVLRVPIQLSTIIATQMFFLGWIWIYSKKKNL